MPGNVQTAKSLDVHHQNFFLHKVQVNSIPWRRMIYKGILVSFYLPLISGILLQDIQLFVVGACCIGFSIFMLIADGGKGDAFQVSEKCWIRFIPFWGKTVDFSLADCDLVAVNYFTIRRRFRLAGQPKLLPSSITFHRTNQEFIILPLVSLGTEKGEWLDSHEVEFYFAYLLKQYGIQFEVPENEELAGDWKAVNSGLLS